MNIGDGKMKFGMELNNKNINNFCVKKTYLNNYKHGDGIKR